MHSYRPATYAPEPGARLQSGGDLLISITALEAKLVGMEEELGKIRQLACKL